MQSITEEEPTGNGPL